MDPLEESIMDPQRAKRIKTREHAYNHLLGQSREITATMVDAADPDTSGDRGLLIAATIHLHEAVRLLGIALYNSGDADRIARADLWALLRAERAS